MTGREQAMLQSLRIENFALIDQLELELGQGLHVLTGETGAGKSILLDAIDCVLGGKPGGRPIRSGCDRALLEATFALSPDLATWLQEQAIEAIEDSLICSRELVQSSNGLRSRSRVNGVLVNRQQLAELRRHLVEITAQGQTVALGQTAQQRDWLDSFGGESLAKQRQGVALAYAAYREAAQTLETRRQSDRDRLRQQDLDRFQLEELTQAELSDPEELTQLSQERDRLAHVVELQQQSYRVYQALDQSEEAGSASDRLGEAEQGLTQMVVFDPSLQPWLQLLQEAIAQVQEVSRQLYRYGEGLESDPDRLAAVGDRIQLLKQLCRKYGPELKDAIAYQQELQQRLADDNDENQSLEYWEAELAQRQQTLIEESACLTALRQATAQTLEQKLIAELAPLAMERVRFQVELQPLSEPGPTGAEQVCFRFSPNPGEPLQPLSETASGGEMSRFLLALKLCFSEADPVGTLVFDEIDAGVSGRVSQAIAEKLQQLGRRHQVLCVTHQPLIAALADHHYRVRKQVSGDRTHVELEALRDRDQRRQELAELAGGNSAEEAISFADSLLKQAEASGPASTTKPNANKPKRATKR